MFKKLFSTALLLGAFMFIAGQAAAQLNFFNGSPCAIQVKAAAENGATPCLGPTCATAVVNIPPGGFAVLPVGICFFAGPYAYRAVKFSMVGGISAFADRCAGPNPTFFVDCQGNPRQLRITSPTFAGIF